jgi:hypothetical protein
MTGRRLAIVTAILNGGIATLALLHYTHVAIVVNHGTQPTIPYEFKLASKPSAHCTVPSVPVEGWKTCFFLGRLRNEDTILARFGRLPDPAEDPTGLGRLGRDRLFHGPRSGGRRHRRRRSQERAGRSAPAARDLLRSGPC